MWSHIAVEVACCTAFVICLKFHLTVCMHVKLKYFVLCKRSDTKPKMLSTQTTGFETHDICLGRLKKKPNRLLGCRPYSLLYRVEVLNPSW